MIMFVVQSALLLAIAFTLGCTLGALAYRRFGVELGEAIPALAWRGPAPALSGPSPVARIGFRPRKRKRAKPAAPVDEGVSVTAEQKGQATDDLKKIRGVGRQIEIRLHNLGVHSFAQIAAWNAKDRKEWGSRLAFPGRIEREDWVGQAKKLARGKETRFSRRVARGEVPSSNDEE